MADVETAHLLSGRNRRILSRVIADYSAEALVALVEDLEAVISMFNAYPTQGTYSIDCLQPGVAQDIESQIPPRLNSAISHIISCVGECQILLLHGELFASDIKGYDGQFINCGVGGEQISLLLIVVLGSWNGIVDGLAEFVIHQSESGACIGNGTVPASVNFLAIDGGRSALELPEALRIIDRGVVRGLPSQSFLVDVSKGVKGDSVIWVILVFV